MQCLNVLRSLPIMPLSSFQSSCGSLALVIINPMRFFFPARERKSHGPRDILILSVRQLIFQEGTLHEAISFYKLFGDRQGVQKSLVSVVTFFLPFTFCHALVKYCNWNLEPQIVLPKTGPCIMSFIQSGNRWC